MPTDRFERKPLPERFCNLDRLLASMKARGLDGLVLSTPLNVFYLSGFNAIAHKADEPRPYAVLLSRHAPDHPILVLADYYLGTLLVQPSWVRDIRPFRAVMMPLDREPQRHDIDRFIPREAGELAQVRVATHPVAPREHRQVVVVLGDDPLAEELEGRRGGDLEQPVVALAEREQQTPVLLGQVTRQRPLDPAEDRLAGRIRPDQHQCVVRNADERRRQDGEERLVVVAVVEEAQVGKQVDDLLLAEVAAARSPVGRQVECPQLLLEPLGIRACREEQDDLARRRDACVDELADAPGDVPRLGAAPVDAGLSGRGLVGDEQLHRLPERRGKFHGPALRG